MASDLKRISGLWLKDSKAGGKYMAGKSDEPIPAGSKLLIFKNDHKETDDQPDYQLMIATEESEPATNGTAQGGQHSAPANTTTPGPSAAQTRAAMAAAPADDIPF